MSERGSDDIWPKRMTPNHDGLIPPWQDMATLCKHISCSPSTVENWVAEGILPPPRKRGGELMWKWSEVDDYLTHGSHQAADIDRIREATRRIVEETPAVNTPAIDDRIVTAPSSHELLKGIQSLLDGAAISRTLFVTDAELIQRLGVPEQLGRDLLQDFDTKHPTFPKKQELWGDRRYWPAVKAWLDKTCGLDLVERQPRKNSRTKKR
jgi:predicted DNA-binding transcriptional regulator AlpA